VISHTTAQFRKLFAELPAEVQRQARRAYRIFRENPNHTSLRLSLSIPHGQFIPRALALAIEQSGFCKAMISCGIGSAHTQTTINFSHNRAEECNKRPDADRRNASQHPLLQRTAFFASRYPSHWSAPAEGVVIIVRQADAQSAWLARHYLPKPRRIP